MHLGKMAATLCCGFFSISVFANIQATSADANTLPPAIAKLASLNKSAPKTDVSKQKIVSQIVKSPAINPGKISNKSLSALNAANAVKIKKPAPAVAAAPVVQLAQNNEQLDVTNQIDANPKVMPEFVEFSQEDLQKRQDEVGNEVIAAKEKEAIQVAEAETTKQYYDDHQREIKLQKIAQGLSTQMPAKLVDPNTVDPHAKEQAELKKAVLRSLTPVTEASNVKQAEHEHMFNKYENGQDDASKSAGKRNVASNDDPIFQNKPAAHESLMTAQVNAVKLKTPVQVATKKPTNEIALPSADDEKTLPDYAYLPENAQIVAGNPYKDEFFIVGKDSPEKLKQMADEAQHKDYIAPVVLTAREKVTNENAVVGLIKKVSSQVASAPKFAIDPFSQSTKAVAKKQPVNDRALMAQFAKQREVKNFAFNEVKSQVTISKKIAMNKPAIIAHEAVLSAKQPMANKKPSVAQFVKPHEFNSKRSQENENVEMTKLVSQMEASLENKTPKQLAIKTRNTHAVANHTVVKNDVLKTSAKSPAKVKHVASAKQQQITKAVIAKQKFAPVVINYADVADSKTKTKLHLATRTLATKKQSHNGFVVKSYASLVHGSAMKKPIKVSHAKSYKPYQMANENSEDLPPAKPFREVKKTAMQVSENSEPEHSTEPDNLPETF